MVAALETDLAAFRDRLPAFLDAVDSQPAEAWLDGITLWARTIEIDARWYAASTPFTLA